MYVPYEYANMFSLSCWYCGMRKAHVKQRRKDLVHLSLGDSMNSDEPGVLTF